MALLTALLSIPLMLVAGLAVDFSRYSSSSRHLQALTDITALRLANSEERDPEKLTELALQIIHANNDVQHLSSVVIEKIEATENDVDVELSGKIPAMFMGLAGYGDLESRTSALAERSVKGTVEVALVLDNTWSMSKTAGNDMSKIDALKSAATDLVKELMVVEDGTVRVALVPYADYVNVGKDNRNAPWLDVGDDYYRGGAPLKCTTKDSKQVCTKRAPKKTCTRVVDGVSETYTCGGECTSSKTVKVKPYKSCTGGGGTSYSWFGCVGSRRKYDNRLHDKWPTDKYPGYLETRHYCPNPIVKLSPNKSELLPAINDMQISRGSYYRPLTYIPAGLIWGHNVLSPGGPLGTGRPYDDRNTQPRKVIILMTDGENTLRFSSSRGKHVKLSGSANKQKVQMDITNRDTMAVCNFIKSNKVEIFSVAFMVENADSKSLLGECASGADHYYDASDSEALIEAFKGIGQSLRVVRLAR